MFKKVLCVLSILSMFLSLFACSKSEIVEDAHLVESTAIEKKYEYKEGDTIKEVTPLIYDYCQLFSEGLAQVGLNGKYGFIDKTGKEVIPLIYDGAYDFTEGLAKVKLNDKWGLIDKTGKEVIPLIYDSVYDFSDGLACVMLNGKYGFIDKTGKEVIPIIYDYLYGFSEGLACAILNSKYGYIDKTGKEVIPFIYGDGIEFYIVNSYSEIEFTEGYARVGKDGKWGYLTYLPEY